MNRRTGVSAGASPGGRGGAAAAGEAGAGGEDLDAVAQREAARARRGEEEAGGEVHQPALHIACRSQK